MQARTIYIYNLHHLHVMKKEGLPNMKKTLLVLVLITLASMPAFAQAETILSLSAGANTGFVGFTLERLVNSHSGYAGFGVGVMQDLKLSVGYRYYLPDTHSGQGQRSNIYISPNGGATFSPVYTWDPQKQISTFEGYHSDVWGGVTMGYDHRWGSARQYRLTFEGGLASGGHESQPISFGVVPIFSFGLGYVF